MRQSSLEKELALWIQNLTQNLKLLLYTHERFTWITLLLAVVPSPFTAIIAILLAMLQLVLYFKGKIPGSERNLLFLSLFIGIANFGVTIIIIKYLAKEGWATFQILNPFWLFKWLRQKLTPNDMWHYPYINKAIYLFFLTCIPCSLQGS